MIIQYDLDDLPDILLALSKNITKYRHDNSGNLSPEEKEFLSDLEELLMVQALDLHATAVELKLAESQEAFEKLQGLVDDANQTLGTLAQVKKAINIATAAVGLAGAIVSQNPVAIGQQANGMYEVLTE